MKRKKGVRAGRRSVVLELEPKVGQGNMCEIRREGAGGPEGGGRLGRGGGRL